MADYDHTASSPLLAPLDMPPSRAGKLSSLSFAVKDNIDIKGYVTGNGNPSWQNTHLPAIQNATCVDQLLQAGAHYIGKTITDEITRSLDGENYFYGTPLNPKAPDRVPGGSSSGSASAVACGLADFTLGTDSAGSIRVPASHCGIIGMRPTLQRISESGVIPFSPHTSTVGAFATQLHILENVMSVLLDDHHTPDTPIRKIYLLEDAFLLANPEVTAALQPIIATLNNTVPVTLSNVTGEDTTLTAWFEKIFAIVQSVEVWDAMGDWMETAKPELGPRVAATLAKTKSVDRSGYPAALALREHMSARVSQFLRPGDLFCFPTVPMIAPLKGELNDTKKYLTYRKRTMIATCFSGVAWLPEISLPVANVNGAPLGLSFAAAGGQDRFLLSAVKRLFPGF